MGGSFVLGPGESSDGTVQCRAEYHGPHGDFRCEIMSPPAMRHLGDHRAPDPKAGGNFYWTELVATYPGAGPARNAQVGGEHYKKFKIQPWDVIDEYGLDFYAGNALKYLLRDKGNRVEDLKKCRHYLDRLIEIEESRGRGE